MPEPRLSLPESQPSDVEQRLAGLEKQLASLIEYLGLRVKLTSSDTPSAGPLIETGAADRLGRLERDYQAVQGRLQQVQLQLDQSKPAAAPAPPVQVEEVAQGRLVVLNLTGLTQYFSVNGYRYYVAPGRTDFLVPRQPVEAYLPTREAPKVLGTNFWRWTGKEYEMRIEIKNQDAFLPTAW